MSDDQRTADAFASSWNNLPAGSVYTAEQFEDWLAPLTRGDVAARTVLELGCGNGSLMAHMIAWQPTWVQGIDLGASVLSARANLGATGATNWSVDQADLTSYQSEGYDLVYSIGVLHHLQDPALGFDAVLRNVRSGGLFHCWVYAREGNGVVIPVVEPIRRITSHLPWWFTKYLVATPLIVPFFLYAKVLAMLPSLPWLAKLPLYQYSLWIAKREFGFFRHVAFDQLVTPRTVYIDRATVDGWLGDPRVDPGSTYLIFRNGNSWKFGGRRA